MTTGNTDQENNTETDGRMEVLVKCQFLYEDRDAEYKKFIEQMPDTHWAKYDLSAVRLGWEAHKLLGT